MSVVPFDRTQHLLASLPAFSVESAAASRWLVFPHYACRITSEYLRGIGQQLLSDPERSAEPLLLVEGLLGLRDKLDQVLEGPFQKDKQFIKARGAASSTLGSCGSGPRELPRLGS